MEGTFNILYIYIFMIYIQWLVQWNDCIYFAYFFLNAYIAKWN